MPNNGFLHNHSDFPSLIRIVAQETSIDPALVEKDYWINGSEFTARVVRSCLEKMEVKLTYIEPGSPWVVNPQCLVQL